MVFVLTFVVFPGAFFSTNLNMMKGMKNEFTWYTLTVITIFNVFDTVGRKLGGYLHLSISATVTYSLSALRLVFIYTAIHIVTLGKSDLTQSSIFSSDTFKIINLVLFATSNGFTSTLCAIKAPQFVREDQREQVGLFVGLFIGLGILGGAIVAIPVGSVLEQYKV